MSNNPSSVRPPEPAMMLPSEILHNSVELPHKPGAQIHYSIARPDEIDTSPVLVVFLNGLMSDKATWLPVMAGVIRQQKAAATPFSSWPTMLAYDRYGQGLTSDTDPKDKGQEQGRGHDVKDAAMDLHYLINEVNMQSKPKIVLVANSIGCAIARLFAHEHSVAAILMLDSIVANSDFDFWPNPDAPDFRPSMLPEDMTIEQLREQRMKFAAIFAPDVKNKEGLDRRSLSRLLPYSDRPMLGQAGNRPWITVVGHDFQRFAEESLRAMGTPISLTMRYSNALWHRYNQGLAKLTDPELSEGPFQAEGCGHFIQKDDPKFVITHLLDLLVKVKRTTHPSGATTSWLKV
ncbi:uncharacterized protein KY384_000427 [Bacidia gigantensis]|uniref:uncharacterized protein n=1 Tax=Bacidia gigantensis TaxID=2732470 RepID=UPI001D049F4A|nr:uncharacterized protein KY384_000427 [Bacidia gigantensis]KAG8525667.1 hypothetical protein KY384_000427 [Bacidia gigantensis]